MCIGLTLKVRPATARHYNYRKLHKFIFTFNLNTWENFEVLKMYIIFNTQEKLWRIVSGLGKLHTERPYRHRSHFKVKRPVNARHYNYRKLHKFIFTFNLNTRKFRSIENVYYFQHLGKIIKNCFRLWQAIRGTTIRPSASTATGRMTISYSIHGSPRAWEQIGA
jgi:hypothetical protein